MTDTEKRTYIKLGIALGVFYVLIIGFYYFLGYGKVSTTQKDANISIDNISKEPGKSVKLRPGSYLVNIATPDNSYRNTVVVFPFINKVIQLKSTDYSMVIKNSLPGSDTFNVSATKRIDKSWLVGKAENNEVAVIVVMKFTNGTWLQVERYTLPESQKKLDTTHFDYLVPPDVSAYIKSELMK